MAERSKNINSLTLGTLAVASVIGGFEIAERTRSNAWDEAAEVFPIVQTAEQQKLFVSDVIVYDYRDGKPSKASLNPDTAITPFLYDTLYAESDRLWAISQRQEEILDEPVTIGPATVPLSKEQSGYLVATGGIVLSLAGLTGLLADKVAKPKTQKA